jgi:hypothetical protein
LRSVRFSSTPSSNTTKSVPSFLTVKSSSPIGIWPISRDAGSASDNSRSFAAIRFSTSVLSASPYWKYRSAGAVFPIPECGLWKL